MPKLLQVRKLGEKEWEFENAKKAFGDTMRKFAPGGGAGHFLANAIARRTDAVSSRSDVRAHLLWDPSQNLRPQYLLYTHSGQCAQGQE